MCDRWEDADDDTELLGASKKGRVARLGIAGFVASAVAGAQEQQQSNVHDHSQRIVIVDSKREQRAAAAAAAVAAAAPPAAGQSAMPRPPVPKTAVSPPPGTLLLVHKAGTVLQQLHITNTLTLFGRLPCNDIVGDHASISRQHAAIFLRQQQQQQGNASRQLEAVVWDLGSAHGTFVQGKRISKGQQYALAPGEAVQFGASTRSYTVQLPQLMPPPPPAAAAAATKTKRPRVKFADDDDEGVADGAAAAAPDDAAAKRSKLEKVVGYSDGGHFQARVGPQAVTACSTDGKFAHLLDTKVIIKPVNRRPQQQQQQQEQIQAGNCQPEAPDDAQHQQQQPDKLSDAEAELVDIQPSSKHQVACAGSDAKSPGEQQQQQQRPSESGAAGIDAAVNSTNAAAATDVPVETASENTAAAAASGIDVGRTPSGSGIARSWSGGAARMLMPPQLRQKLQTGQQQQQQTQQAAKQPHSSAPPDIVSSLYGQLPATKQGQ